MGDVLHSVIYLSGLGVWTLIAFVFGCLLFEIGIGAIAAASWCRWCVRVERLNGRPIRIRDACHAFFVRWWEFIGWRGNGRIEYQHPGGWWKGIGNWRAWQQNQSAEIGE